MSQVQQQPMTVDQAQKELDQANAVLASVEADETHLAATVQQLYQAQQDAQAKAQAGTDDLTLARQQLGQAQAEVAKAKGDVAKAQADLKTAKDAAAQK